MTVEVRAARPSDWESVYPFLITTDRPLDSLEAAFQRYSRKLDSELECVLVAVEGEEIIGVALAHQWDDYLMSGRKQIRFSTLHVLPDQRRRGAGRALFEGIIQWSESVGATWLEWYASPAAVPFYERLGFRGVTCPQPEYPYFEIEFAKRADPS
jgi:GNAT superfamily N-acetyltransferase